MNTTCKGNYDTNKIAQVAELWIVPLHIASNKDWKQKPEYAAIDEVGDSEQGIKEAD